MRLGWSRGGSHPAETSKPPGGMTVSLASLTHRYGSDAQDNRAKISPGNDACQEIVNPGGNLTPQTQRVLNARRP